MQNVNYAGFDELLKRYGGLGFQVLGFPCNQFGAQAPCSSECERAYFYHKLNITEGALPAFVFDKVIVNGPGTLEAFAVLKGGGGQDIAWNYEKFLVGADGKVVKRYLSAESPKAAEAEIRRLVGLDSHGLGTAAVSVGAAATVTSSLSKL